MIELFQSILSDARGQSISLRTEITLLKSNIDKYKHSILQCEKYINQIQVDVKRISPKKPYCVFEDTDSQRHLLWSRAAAGIDQYKQVLNLQWWEMPKNPIVVYRADSPAYRHLLTSWGLAIKKLKELIEESEKEIKRLQKEKDELDFWILEKETRWNALTEEQLNEQLTSILMAGKDLSKLLLDRDVELKFEYRDGGSPAYVSTSFKERKKVFLSIDVLGNQPRNVVDLYKGLILHELGHFLLHLGDTFKEYRQFRKLLRKKITVAPDFYSIFNILLDEQLERVLRDRTKEWQTWFNRLTFHLRTMELCDLKKRLQKSKYPEKLLAEIDLSELTEKRQIKTYRDEDFPMLAIQSAEFLKEEYGFNRMEAFFYTFRGRLPRDTVTEEWLQLCLDQIPSDFKSLDLNNMHRLAVRIYRIITEDLQAKKLAVVTIKKNDGKKIELPVPDVTGLPPAGLKSDTDRFIIDINDKQKKGGGITPVRSEGGSDHSSISRKQNIGNPIHNPEGEPEPPKIEEKNESRNHEKPSKTKAPDGNSRKVGKPTSKNIKGNQNIRRSPAWSSFSGSGGGPAKSTGKSKGGKKKKGKRKKHPKVSKHSPNPIISKSPSVTKDLSDSTTQAKAEHKKELPSLKKDLSEQLNKKLKEIRESLKTEQAGIIEKSTMTPEGGKSSDFKNTDSTKRFPACEKIIHLKTDTLKMRKLQLISKRYVQWLRPSLSRIDQVKQMQLKQSAGKSMMNSAVKNFIIYGEPQIFRNFKAEDREEYSDVHISFLLDTSASMQTNERMKHAKTLVSLFAECLTECPGISTSIYAYNQNLYLCGDHDNYSVAQLKSLGKTNEAAALHHIHKDLEAIARPIKLVIVVTDGLPTACSVESVKWQVTEMETRGQVQFIGCIFSKEHHPAYKYHIDFSGGITRASVSKLGKRVVYIL